MKVGEWVKRKIATHVLQPLYNLRLPGRPWRPLAGFRERRWNDDRTALTAFFSNGRLEISALEARQWRVLVFFDSVRRTPVYDGEYWSYAVVPRGRRPLALKEDDRFLTLSAVSGGEKGLTLRLDKTAALLAAFDDGRKIFGQERPAAAAGDWVSFDARPSENVLYLGFGLKTGSLFKNGKTYLMWNSDFADMRKDSDPLYQSCPFAIGLTESGSAHGLFFDNPHQTRFRLPKRGRPGPLRYRAMRGPLALYLLGGPRLPDVVRQFADVTGRYSLPPLWALGHHHSRYQQGESAERLIGIARRFRERGLPLDALHIDIGHMNGYRCFTWDPERFPDPARFLAGLRALRLHPVVITDPGLKQDDDWDVYRAGKAGGHFIADPDGAVVLAPVWPGPAAFPDFGRPATARWWGGLFSRHTENKIDGFWIDMNEPAAFTPRRTLPDGVLLSVAPAECGGGLSRRDHAGLHNYYGFLMAKATAEGLALLRPAQRTFLFTRSSFAGIQRYASSWTGDNQSTWEHLRLALPMLMNLGLSGQIMTGPDIGGFWGAPSTELFVRFLQAAAFFPFHRNHTADGTPPQEIWEFGPEAEAICLRHLRLRYAFLLYLYTALRQGTVSGDPLCRPLCYDFPGDAGCLDPAVADSQYLSGSSLLVAPALWKGKRERSVYFPRTAEWVCFWTHAVHRGGKSETIATPLDRLPLFVKRGSVLPTVISSAAGFTDTAGLGEQALAFDVYPDDALSGELYLDDGESLAYRDGAYALITMSGRRNGGTITLTIEQTEGRLAEPLARFQGILVRIAWYGKKPSLARVTVNGRDVPAAATTLEEDWLTFRLDGRRLPLQIEVVENG